MSFSEAAEGTGEEYPVVFGISMTPMTQGILIALAGVGAAIYVAVTFLMPKYTEYQELSAQVSEKENQLAQVANERKRLQEIQQNLGEAKAIEQQVMALFPSEKTTTVLPIDLNKIVADQYGRLTKFEPDDAGSVLVTDSSWGSLVNNKLTQQSIAVTFEGDFDQTSNILRKLELYQNLLVVDNIDSELTVSNQPVRFDATNGQLVAAGKPKVKITTSLDLKILTPVSTEELVNQQEAAKEAEEADPNASPSPSS